MNNDIQNVTTTPVVPLARDFKTTQNSKDNESVKFDSTSVSALDANKSDKNTRKDSPNKVTSIDEARKLVEEGNKMLENVQRNLQFKVDDSTKQIVMSIVDKKTGEVIRQVPSEEVLALAKRMQESSGEPGSIVRDRA